MSHNGNYVKLILSAQGRVSPPYCPAKSRYTGFPNEIFDPAMGHYEHVTRLSLCAEAFSVTDDNVADAGHCLFLQHHSALPFPVRPVSLNSLPGHCLLVALLPGQVRGTLYPEDAPVRSMVLACMAFHPNHEQFLYICGKCRQGFLPGPRPCHYSIMYDFRILP